MTYDDDDDGNYNHHIDDNDEKQRQRQQRQDQSCVLLVEQLPGESWEVYDRRRRSYYSRRSYHKKRKRQDGLKEQAQHLRTSNTVLQQEYQRLVHLMQQANQIVVAHTAYEGM